ncbi:MAG: serine hydrolase, partial [Proteobacteria bacterium]|nr:serine hydrolase [Pseudomonadota bacterium]
MKSRISLGALLVAGCLLASPLAARELVPLPEQGAGVPWPTQVWPEGEPGAEVDKTALNALLDRAFSDSAPDDLPGTRSAIVIHRGVLVAERYAKGFAPDRLFISQSMAKSVVGVFVGFLVKDGTLDLFAPVPVTAWQQPGDERAAITFNNLMQMSSGLAFNESYFNPFSSDALPMLFGEARGDMATYAASMPLEHEPGTRWSYASGTTNLISGIVKESVGGDQQRYLAFMQQRLFEPTGMSSAIPEF